MSLRFIDISHYQSGIDLMRVVRNGGLGAVVVKATEGIGWVDTKCDGYVQTLIKNLVPFGFYHFGRKNDATEEAEYFRASTKGYEGLGIPILDWEYGQSVKWVNEFVERYHALTGVWPWIYSNARLFNQGGVNPNCSRWVAGYPKTITDISYGQNNDFPYECDGLVCAWQFTDRARIPGYSGNLDGDVFYGSAAQWHAYVEGDNARVTTPEPSGISEGDTLKVTELSDTRIVLEKN